MEEAKNKVVEDFAEKLTKQDADMREDFDSQLENS